MPIGLTALLLVAAGPLAAAAQDSSPVRQHHRWARFIPGSWKTVRVVTETLDSKGAVRSTSTTESTSVLQEVSDKSYTLEVESRMEVAGKSFEAAPQIITQGFHGESEGQQVRVTNGGRDVVTIDGRQIPCDVYEVRANGQANRQMTRLYYAPGVAPRWLQRVTVSTDPSGQTTYHETRDEVVALQMPYRVGTEIVPTCHVKTVRKNSKGTIITVAVHAPSVPGGIVAHTSKELDARGRTIRRSTLELVEYGATPERRRRGLFKNRASRVGRR